MLNGAVLVGLVFVFGSYLFHAYHVVTFPYDIDYGEGLFLNWVQLIAGGNWGYGSIHEEPYLVGFYPPLYPWIVSFPVQWCGPSLAWGRWLSVLSALGTGVAIFAIVRRISGRLFPAAVGGLLFFLPMHVYFWTVLHRVDSLALFFTMLGLYLSMSGRRVAWCAIPFALALLTRQTTIFAPMSVVAWLVCQKQWRRAFLLGLVSFGIPGTIYLILHAITDGQFLQHTFTYHTDQAFRWGIVLFFAAQFVEHVPIVVGVGLFMLMRRFMKWQCDLPAIYLVSTAAHFYLSGKVGSAWNYMLEPIAALCIMVGTALFEVGRPTNGKGGIPSVLLRILLLVQIVIAFQIPWVREVEDAPTPDASYLDRVERLSQWVRDTEGDCLSEHAGFLVLNGKRITLQPFVMKHLAEHGKWSPQPLIDDLGQKRYRLIILTFDVNRARATAKFQDVVVTAIRNHYQLAGFVAGPGGSESKPSHNWNYWVYRPK